MKGDPDDQEIRHRETGWSSNDWVSALGGPIGRSEPSLSCAVIIPAFENEERLNAVLAALEWQTYPPHLTRIVVVDDGTQPPLELKSNDVIEVRIVRQESQGFGAARARHLGATTAGDVDVLVFLDSDMLPEAAWLSAHMNIHHRLPRMVGCGFRRHVTEEAITATDLAAKGGVEKAFSNQEYVVPEWLDREWERTADGVEKCDRLWRTTSSGNLSVSRLVYRDSGGFDGDGFRTWGGEDNDFGYRALLQGAYIVPIREALAWHLGLGTSRSPGAEERLHGSRLQLGSRIFTGKLPNIRGLIPRFPDVYMVLDVRQSSLSNITNHLPSLVEAANHLRITFGLIVTDPWIQAVLSDLLSMDARFQVIELDHESLSPASVSRVVGTMVGLDWQPSTFEWISKNVREGGRAWVRVVDDAARTVGEVILSRVKNQIAWGQIDERSAFDAFGGSVIHETSLRN